MADMAYAGSLAGGILKTYYEGAIRDQLYQDTILLSRIKKNTKDIQGGAAVIALHTGRNLGIGARANGVKLPAAGAQTHTQATVPLKYLYGRAAVSGPDIANTRGNAGAFANVVDVEMSGLQRDLSQDVNRQLHSDGSGILCIQSGTSATTSNAIQPYHWSPAGKYIYGNTGMQLQTVDAATMADFLPTSTDTSTPLASTASTTNTTLYFTGTGTGAAALVGRFRSLMNFATNASATFEVSGLMAAVHDTNLIGDQTYAYDTTNSVTNFTTPLTTAIDLTIASNVHRFQGIDANANSQWRSYCLGAGGTTQALSLQLMDRMWSQLNVSNGGRTSLILTTPALYNKYGDLLRQDRRYVDEKTLDGGFMSLAYKNIPLVADRDTASGNMHFIDESTFNWYVKEDFGFIEDGSGSPLLYIQDADAWSITMRAYVQLGCSRRNSNGRLFDLNEA